MLGHVETDDTLLLARLSPEIIGRDPDSEKAPVLDQLSSGGTFEGDRTGTGNRTAVSVLHESTTEKRHPKQRSNSVVSDAISAAKVLLPVCSSSRQTQAFSQLSQETSRIGDADQPTELTSETRISHDLKGADG